MNERTYMRVRRMTLPDELSGRGPVVAQLSVEQRELLERAVNILDGMRFAVEEHEHCCTIYSPEAIAELMLGADFLATICEQYDSYHDGDPAAYTLSTPTNGVHHA